MPLVQSSSKPAVSENIRREMDAGKPQRQAVAIALNTQRRNRDVGGPIAGFAPEGYAGGGFPRGFGMHQMPHPRGMKLTLAQQSAPPIGRIPNLPKLPHLAGGGFVGFIPSAVPGRTDRHPVDVPAGSYVLPAEHVSSLGEGNSIAGGKILHDMFPHSESKEAATQRNGEDGAPLAAGGMATGAVVGGDGELVPVMVAGGEFIVSPEDVAAVGGGDLKRGHKHLDEWVMLRRKKHIQTLKKLPPPAQD